MFFYCLQQIQRVTGIVAVVLEGVLDRFRHHDIGGEMQHGFKAVLAEKVRNGLFIGEVSDHKLTTGDRPTVSGGQVIENNNVVSGFAQLPYDMTTYIPGSAGYQNFHDRSSLLP